MTIEQRLTEALRATADFAPSPDLYSRVSRSIEEDRAHRRRIWFWGLVSALITISIAIFLFLNVKRAPSGLVAPGWVFEVSETVILITVIVVFGPMLRRLGGVYVGEVFHLGAEQGVRFVRLIEIAFYLNGLGYVLVTSDLVHLEFNLALGPALAESGERIGLALAGLGLGHAQNLALLPVLGLFYNAVRRRVIRAQAGADAPPSSPVAVRADRLVTAIAFTLAALGMAGVLVLIGLGLGGA
jgi:hypothetical protein